MDNLVIEPVRMAALLNARDVARLLKVSLSKAGKLMADGEIDTVRLGRAVRCTEAALNEFIERNTVRPERRWPDDYR
jgi:excisionase family DNA binding protein